MGSVSTAVAVLGIALAAASGVPGLFLARDRELADRAGSLLLGLAAACAAAVTALVARGAGDAPLALPWPVLGERITVGVDGLSAFFLLPALGIPFLASVYGLSYWPASQRTRSARRLRVAFGLVAAGIGLVLIARHAFAFLVGWEIMALSAFLAVTAEDDVEDVRRAGFVYLVCTRVSTLALFGVFALLHAATGSFDLLGNRQVEPATSTALFALALLGFGLKAGAVPLHLWLPGAHAMAPTHVSAVLSGVVIKVGIYGILRIASLLSPVPVPYGAGVLVLGVASAVFGVALALGQHQFKRLLAYHSVENIGIILMGIGLALLGRSLGRPEVELLGLAGALLHTWNHALFKALLFLGAGSVLQASGTGEIDRLGGLARRMPRTAFCFGVGAVAICGLPPLNGFVSELLVYLGLLRTASGHDGSARLLAVVAIPALALVGGLAAACFLKVYGSVFLGEARSPAAAPAFEVPRAMLAPMGALVLACFALGIAPQIAVPSLEAALRSFDPGLASTGLLLATAAPFGAIALAAAGLLGSAAAAALLVTRLPPCPFRPGPTWDCGYAAPAPRMQITASSFAGGLLDLFRWALWTERSTSRVAGRFPKPSWLRTHLPDPVLDRVVLPAADWLARASLWLRWLQHGHVHWYVLYILSAVLVGLLAAGGELR